MPITLDEANGAGRLKQGDVIAETRSSSNAEPAFIAPQVMEIN